MSYRILVVDGERHLCTVMQYALEHAGFIVETATMAYEAMGKLVEEVVPDAIVIGDLKPLPETTLGLVNDIRQAYTGIKLPIVVMSTQTLPIDRTCCLAAGADAFIAKPFSTKHVVDVLESLIQRSQA